MSDHSDNLSNLEEDTTFAYSDLVRLYRQKHQAAHRAKFKYVHTFTPPTHIGERVLVGTPEAFDNDIPIELMDEWLYIMLYETHLSTLTVLSPGEMSSLLQANEDGRMHVSTLEKIKLCQNLCGIVKFPGFRAEHDLNAVGAFYAAFYLQTFFDSGTATKMYCCHIYNELIHRGHMGLMNKLFGKIFSTDHVTTRPCSPYVSDTNHAIASLLNLDNYLQTIKNIKLNKHVDTSLCQSQKNCVCIYQEMVQTYYNFGDTLPTLINNGKGRKDQLIPDPTLSSLPEYKEKDGQLWAYRLNSFIVLQTLFQDTHKVGDISTRQNAINFAWQSWIEEGISPQKLRQAHDNFLSRKKVKLPLTQAVPLLSNGPNDSETETELQPEVISGLGQDATSWLNTQKTSQRYDLRMDIAAIYPYCDATGRGYAVAKVFCGHGLVAGDDFDIAGSEFFATGKKTVSFVRDDMIIFESEHEQVCMYHSSHHRSDLPDTYHNISFDNKYSTNMMAEVKQSLAYNIKIIKDQSPTLVCKKKVPFLLVYPPIRTTGLDGNRDVSKRFPA